ncbi:MAG: hypothetical protein AAGE43_11385 [Pseudomonadota bacterium]
MTDVRLIHGILALLLAILGVLIALLIQGGPEAATGAAHPQIPGMNVGGDGLARLGGMGWLMATLQTLVLLLIHALLALGVSERHRTSVFWVLVAVGAALSMAVWWGMYLSYVTYLADGTGPLLFGYPVSTALMLFGVFLAGSYFCGLYIWGFRRFIFPEEDEAAYEALRAEALTPRKPEQEA